MRTKHILGAAAAAALLAAGPLSAGLAAASDAADHGVGTGAATATLLGVEIGEGGSILSVRLVGHDATASIDPAAGDAFAEGILHPLDVTSSVEALNLAAPSVGTRSTGAQDSRSADPFAGVPSNPAVSGSGTTALSSVVDQAGARSLLDAALSDVGVAGGLVHLPAGSLTLAADSAPDASGASQGVDVPSATVLDLSALLEGIGISLSSLDLNTLVRLLDQLGVTLPIGSGLDGAAVEALADALDGSVDAILDSGLELTTPITTEVCAQIDAILDGTLGDVSGSLPDGEDLGGVELLDGIGDAVDSLPGTEDLLNSAAIGDLSCQALVDSATATVQTLVDTIRSELRNLLRGTLLVLDGTALLTITDVQAGLVASAAGTVDDSVAKVTASIGDVRVGALAVPGVADLDLSDTLASISGAADLVTAAVSDVLAIIDPALGNVVDVDLLAITESVGADGDVVNAVSTLSALVATITPPAVLSAAILGTDDAVGDVITELGGTVPALAPVMEELEVVLGEVSALAGPTTVSVVSLSSTGQFVAHAPGDGSTTSDSPATQLPRTGADTVLPALLAAAFAGAALGIRRLVRSASATR
ncbi:MAG TPA: hypothetical protein VMN58_10230 [Acidimicrobiales bacterium]|nr:hypothetical protein [Acidimicrobiales bacterium]